MNQLELTLTLKGESGETLFQLYQDGENFRIKGYSKKFGELEYKIELDDETNSFYLSENIVHLFEENKEIIDQRLLSLTQEWIEVKSEGLEADDDVERPLKKPGYGAEDIYVENKPFSISTIMELINEKELEINPDFQRNFVWDNTRQSKLIESILLGLPLPSIYLSQYKDGRLTVVDGLQRINTIKRFMDDELVLCNMEYLTECNDRRYSELKEVIPLLQFRRFKQTQIMCFVIDYRSPMELKYDLFRRLNTGGKVLNDQEIRNCLSRPNLQKLLSDMIKSEEFKRATNNSIKDTRMAAQESALRFMYFYDQYSFDNPIGSYNGEMGTSLDKYVEKLNPLSPDELDKYLCLFKKGMQMSYDVFGTNAFRKVSIYETKKNAVNKSLMMAISVLFARHYDDYRDKVAKGVNLTNALAQLLVEDSNLNKVITTSTTHKASIEYTITTLRDKLFAKFLK